MTRSQLTILILLGTLLCLGLPSCKSKAGDTATQVLTFTGTVVDTAGDAVVGATVYLVPAYAIETQETKPITAAGLLDATEFADDIEPYDEPLEDTVRRLAVEDTLTTATTGVDGTFSFATVPGGLWYVYAEPSDLTGDNPDHFPGGSVCFESYSDAELTGANFTIVLSTVPQSWAKSEYVGLDGCMGCHEGHEGALATAHRVGFRAMGSDYATQDAASQHPEIDDAYQLFLDVATYDLGTAVYHYDYGNAGGFSDFRTAVDLTNAYKSDDTLFDPLLDDHVILYLWQTGGECFITFKNNYTGVVDPNDELTVPVALTYGGAVQKQRFMLDFDGLLWDFGAGKEALQLRGLYPILQYHTDGSDGNSHWQRKQFRGYHTGWYFDGGGTKMFTLPPSTKNIERNCMGCHVTGFEQMEVTYDIGDGTMRTTVLCDGVGTTDGYDIDDDGGMEDVNIGCETCHGPGAAHVAAATAGDGGKYIVSPQNLSPSRANALCGRCHDRIVGQGLYANNDHPQRESDNLYAYPGLSREELMDDFLSRNGPKSGDYHADGEHSKSHHMNVTDMSRSAHWRNPYHLLTCFDCHDMHSVDEDRSLVASATNTDADLCTECHSGYMPSQAEHTAEMFGVAHGTATASCVDCHMTKTMKTGSGWMGYLLDSPNGDPGDDDRIYYENDMTSHMMDVIRKTDLGVAGVAPSSAMPAPYTMQCGQACHDPSLLKDL